jgi:type IV fimbrial biogenesis protein FimT
MERPTGFTLLELIVSVTIVATLLAWGIPGFRELRQNAERTREVNQFVQAIYLARSEAIKRNGVVSLCPSVDGEFCGPPGTAWQSGWIVFVNLDRDSPALRDPGEELLRVYEAWPNGDVVANRATLSFRPFGQMGVNGTFAFCDERGTVAARAVIISRTGRPRTSARNASGQPLVCI